jgi:hypothetical protein
LEGKVFLQISEKDLGKIVQLPVRPKWGLGIISKIESRFAFIMFETAEDKIPKKYYLAENQLKLATDQNRPLLTKRARVKNKKIKIKAKPVAIEPETTVVKPVKTAKPVKAVKPAKAVKASKKAVAKVQA